MKRLVLVGFASLALFAGHAVAQSPAAPSSQAVTPTAPAATAPAFNIDSATDAWLAKLPPAARAKSDAYFEGGYWLQLWDFVVAALILLALLHFGWSARIRDWAERTTRRAWLQVVLYWIAFFAIVFVVQFPWTVYESFVREHQYGLGTDTFAHWLRDTLVGGVVSLVFFALPLILVYWLLRRRQGQGQWWIGGTLIAFVFIGFGATIGPVYIAPLFNKYTPLTDARVRDPILSMARANGIAANNVYVMDASKQTSRMSANVSGMFGTERITLNDNLLNGAQLPEIESVMGHEMGHYVLNHVYKGIILLSLLIGVVLAFAQMIATRLFNRFGSAWGVRSLSDVAGLPVIAVSFLFVMLLATPAFNTIVRTQEYEADMFGLNAARQPDGFAQAALHLSTYRKMQPGPIEEFIFYDHPSGRTRIHAAMRWKAEHLAELAQRDSAATVSK